MTTLNKEQQKELSLKAWLLWQIYNRYYRKQMDESEFIIRYLRGELPKAEVEE